MEYELTKYKQFLEEILSFVMIVCLFCVNSGYKTAFKLWMSVTDNVYDLVM